MRKDCLNGGMNGIPPLDAEGEVVKFKAVNVVLSDEERLVLFLVQIYATKLNLRTNCWR